jgi:hypothetical protein
MYFMYTRAAQTTLDLVWQWSSTVSVHMSLNIWFVPCAAVSCNATGANGVNLVITCTSTAVLVPGQDW